MHDTRGEIFRMPNVKSTEIACDDAHQSARGIVANLCGFGTARKVV